MGGGVKGSQSACTKTSEADRHCACMRWGIWPDGRPPASVVWWERRRRWQRPPCSDSSPENRHGGGGVPVRPHGGGRGRRLAAVASSVAMVAVGTDEVDSWGGGRRARVVPRPLGATGWGMSGGAAGAKAAEGNLREGTACCGVSRLPLSPAACPLPTRLPCLADPPPPGAHEYVRLAASPPGDGSPPPCHPHTRASGADTMCLGSFSKGPATGRKHGAAGRGGAIMANDGRLCRPVGHASPRPALVRAGPP